MSLSYEHVVEVELDGYLRTFVVIFSECGLCHFAGVLVVDLDVRILYRAGLVVDHSYDSVLEGVDPIHYSYEFKPSYDVRLLLFEFQNPEGIEILLFQQFLVSKQYLSDISTDEALVNQVSSADFQTLEIVHNVSSNHLGITLLF